MLPALAQILCQEHSGKFLVDAYFAIRMRHVKTFAGKTGRNVSTSGNIVDALKHNGGIARSEVKLVQFNRDDPCRDG